LINNSIDYIIIQIWIKVTLKYITMKHFGLLWLAFTLLFFASSGKTNVFYVSLGIARFLATDTISLANAISAHMTTAEHDKYFEKNRTVKEW
jgi:hypothetical protein